MPDPILSDNCVNDIEFDYFEEIIPGDCDHSYTQIRTWTAMDDCGNETTVSQTIFVTDSQAPLILNAPIDITIDLSLGENIPPPVDLTAFDICDQIPDISVEEITTAGCTYEIIRTYIAKDDCDNSASVIHTITVIEDLDIQIDATKTQICADEFIQLQASPIDSTYNYVWTTDGGEIINPLEASALFSADSEGTYTVNLFVSSGDCESTSTIQIEVGENEIVEIEDNSPICSGDSLMVSIIGGDAWSWTGPNNFSSVDQNILIPDATIVNNGIYSVTVSTGSACEKIFEVELNIGDELVPSVSSNSPICEGSTLELFASGGSSYNWIGPNNWTSNDQNPVINNLELDAGMYSYLVEVSTFSGCTGLANIEIEVLESGDISVVENIEICLGENIELGANGGTSYDWSGPNNYNSNEQFPVIENATFNMAGQYVVLVGNSFNCDVEKTVMVSITDCSCDTDAELSLTQAENCNDLDGVAVFIPSEYTYTWPDNIVASNRNDLADGTYTVTVTDLSGCNEEMIVVITETGDCEECINPVVVDRLIVSTQCDQADGSITLEMEDELSNYSFDWSAHNGSFGVYQNQLNNLFAGVYSVTITDQRNSDCSTVENIIVNNMDASQPSNIDIVPALCGTNNGQVTISPDTLQYYWMDLNVSGSVQNDLYAGTYLVEVTDPSLPNCASIITIVVPQQGGFNSNYTIEANPTCGLANGIVNIFAPDVAPTGIVWDDNFQGDRRTDLASGYYQVVLTNNVGCMDTLEFVLQDDISIVEINLGNITDLLCSGSDNGLVTYSTIPDISTNISYNTSIEDSNGLTYQNGNLAAGDYCIIIRDDNDCIAGQSCFTINSPSQLQVVVEAMTVDCVTGGTINLLTSGGTEEYTYTWADLDPLDNQLDSRENLDQGNYNVTINDANGCEVIANNIVIENCMQNDSLIADTIFVSTFPSTPIIICVDSTLIGAIANTLIECGAPLTGTYTIVNDYCVEYIPNESMMPGDQDEMCVELCDDQGNCVMTTIFIDILPLCQDDLNIFNTESDIVSLADCESTAEYCLDIPITDIDSFHFHVNGVQYNQTTGCSYDSIYVYTYFSIPDAGMNGPYTVDSWFVNGVEYSGEFANMQELVALMNQWDTVDNWTLNENILVINGGSSDNTYGDLRITKVSTGEYGVLDLNSQYVPFALALELYPGENLITVINSTTGCVDSIDVLVQCSEVVTTPDTIDIIIELGMDTTICLDASELSSSIANIESYCEDISTSIVNYEIDNNCITVTGEYLGDDIGCFVYCDDNQVCDTLVIFSFVVVEGATAPPIAMDDDTLTLVNWHVFNFDISLNDTFNIETDSLIIIQNPDNGTVEMNDDFTIDYIPNQDYCGEIDSFVYMIVGPNGTDIATVYIDVLCEDLTIFNGISPNGDGVNDTFVITGINAYKDNVLTIFNRWGNQVYFRHGYTNDTGWDGTWEGRPLPDGTYFYVLDDGEGQKFSGYIQIHR